MIEAQEYQALRKKGYTNAQINEYVEAQEEQEDAELRQSYQQALAMQQQDPRVRASQTMIAGGLEAGNLLSYQLELDSILERVEHLLRGDKPKFINGSIIYVPPTDVKDIILNEHGISEVMRILSLYINKNTILSNYSEEIINWKVYDFGCDLADLFFLSYDKFGMNTPDKRKLYPIICRQIIDVVHSAYLRALNGGERESIRKMISVNQQISDQDQMQGMGGQRPQKSLLNPLSWFRR